MREAHPRFKGTEEGTSLPVSDLLEEPAGSRRAQAVLEEQYYQELTTKTQTTGVEPCQERQMKHTCHICPLNDNASRLTYEQYLNHLLDHYITYHLWMASPCPVCAVSFANTGPGLKSSVHWKVSSICLLKEYDVFNLAEHALLVKKQSGATQQCNKRRIPIDNEPNVTSSCLSAAFYHPGRDTGILSLFRYPGELRFVRGIYSGSVLWIVKESGPFDLPSSQFAPERAQVYVGSGKFPINAYEVHDYAKSLLDRFVASLFWDRPDLVSTKRCCHIYIMRIDHAPPSSPECCSIHYNTQYPIVDERVEISRVIYYNIVDRSKLFDPFPWTLV